jgi:2-keto-4-pentenoate hydratase/2-oxohepta-3-ene-1,7-dioic acid hydratase in catechol pathway
MKILCIGRNYVEHAHELGNAVPTEPVVFMKPHSALTQGRRPVFYPDFTNELHYEGELVFRISKNGKHVAAKDAHLYYDAVTVGVDFTARDKQSMLKEKGLPWEKAKGFDGSAFIGNWVILSEQEKKEVHHFRLYVNDELRQQGDSSLMLFSIDTIIADVSQYFTLNIGDLIFTGTPAGVGECFPGDAITASYQGKKLMHCVLK